MAVWLSFDVDEEELRRAREHCATVEAATEIDAGVWGHTFFEMPVFFEVDGTSVLSGARPLVGVAMGLEWTLRVAKGVGAWDFVAGPGTLYLQLEGYDLTIVNPDRRVAVRTPIRDVEDATAKLSEAVREFMLTEFPSLERHREMGWWFRGEPPPDDRVHNWLPERRQVERMRRGIRRLLDEITSAE
jgi:hypothetical protein